ncbi:hypothetical protein [Yoonia sp.]|uniref:hypothetical protein n=1 Tax=Yoonia sp. TaxID=2212373 RepID=UPI002E08A430|nr:hypothetical protein [Yoonia sp.]
MNIGQKYLITTEGWFLAPDGDNYRGAFGTVHSVVDSESALGIKTNAKSTNWYVMIGDMVIAGCQIHYAIRADDFSPQSPHIEIDHDGKRICERAGITRIYNADASGLVAMP